ncbi:MAG TPA: CDP-diacylglycerol diphosphatase [Devosiaceae bacterium]|nr:CDP-diacylglycerol diphosphatase [Devosiaceae bacterium]
MKLNFSRVLLAGTVGLVAIVATSSLAEEFSRRALGQVVRACSIAQSTLGVSFPCTEVRPGEADDDGYVVIRSPGFASEFLVAPIAPISGIESPTLRTNAATDLWQAAWDTRTDVAAALGRHLPRDAVGLAVNAEGTRTQDHFHIHIDCLQPSVSDALARYAPRITQHWTKLPVALRGDVYWVRAIDSPDLAGVNVARLIDDAPPATDNLTGHATVAVAGATLPDGKQGFYLLANWRDSSAERLLDHNCSVG